MGLLVRNLHRQSAKLERLQQDIMRQQQPSACNNSLRENNDVVVDRASEYAARIDFLTNQLHNKKVLLAEEIKFSAELHLERLATDDYVKLLEGQLSEFDKDLHRFCFLNKLLRQRILPDFSPSS